MDKLLTWITGYLPARIISNDERIPYLERYYIATLFGWRFYLHRFVGSDPDRGLHDHPWSKAYSLILSGFYFEETRMGDRKVRWFNSLTGDTFHRVVLPLVLDKQSCRYIDELQPCWTLFMHTAGNVKPWGFWRKVITEKHEHCVVEKFLTDGQAFFEPYTYQREGSQKDWWLTAPAGRVLRKVAASA